METSKKKFFYSGVALICAIWFALTSWFWAYAMNLMISYPAGIVGLFFWNKVRKIDPNSMINRISLILLVAGLLISSIFLVIIMFFN